MPYQPIFNINHRITNALTSIERARGFLEAAKLSEDWVTHMQKNALILEAHHTTHIEGTHLTLEESTKILQGETLKDIDRDDRLELLNYREAFEFVSEYLLDQRPITESLVRHIHSILVKGVRGDSALPGEYRKIQNYVVNSKTKEVIYEPPPAYEVPRLMAELMEWIQSEKEINAVLISGIIQFQFVHIHPFLDGNGRTARLLTTLYLYQTGYDFKRLFTLSEYYDRDRSQYYQAIQSVRNNGLDLTTWLEYFTNGLVNQLQEIQSKGEKIIKLDVLSLKINLSVFQRQILEFGLQHDPFTLCQLSANYKEISRRTIQRELKKLLEMNLLKGFGATTNRTYSVNSENF